ncbi:hemolysin, partial [Leptotrichia sp. OH3620_COT-345]
MRAAMSPHGLFSVKINEYVGKDIENHDTLTTTGGSINLQAGKNPIGGIGINQEKRDKEGISRNTVLGDIEIGNATGAPINRDITKANEITKDTHNSTNINIEGQTIDYLTNPSRLKEDLDKAKQEIKDIGTAIKESINDRGDDNRNFLGQLGEGRLRTTIDNIAG